jgi:hypothetical protein
MTELTKAESEAEAESTIRSPTPEAKPETKQHAAAKAGLPAVVLSPPLPPPSVSADELIAAMNQQHAIIENVGGKTVIASWEPSPLDPTRQMVVFQNKESFLLRYSNQYVTVEVPDGRGGTRFERASLGHWWLSHRDRRQFRGVTFRPGSPKVVNECLNLWQGWGRRASARRLGIDPRAYRGSSRG